jgi:hypothetical protein
VSIVQFSGGVKGAGAGNRCLADCRFPCSRMRARDAVILIAVCCCQQLDVSWGGCCQLLSLVCGLLCSTSLVFVTRLLLSLTSAAGTLHPLLIANWTSMVLLLLLLLLLMFQSCRAGLLTSGQRPGELPPGCMCCLAGRRWCCCRQLPRTGALQWYNITPAGGLGWLQGGRTAFWCADLSRHV